MGDMIPKKIHYFWFGNNPKTELINKCIASWKKFFPEYEIIEWNEQNYDVNKNAYIREAYKCKKWAFVSDYARFDVLYNIGGIYFDTDVEVLKPFPEELLALPAFTGVESTNVIAPGLVFATLPRLEILAKILHDYENSDFLVGENKKPMTVNARVTHILEECGYKKSGELQIIAGITICPAEYFCGFDLTTNEWCKTEKTLSIHHYACSWQNRTVLHFVKYKIMRPILKEIFGVEGYRKLLSKRNSLFGDKG